MTTASGLVWPTWRPARVFDEAGLRLAQCEQAAPDDPALWRARLNWAQAAGRPDEVVRAAAHLPAESLIQARVLELRAWMAARNGDRSAERAALEAKIALEPADATSLERLADLAVQDGDRQRLSELRRRKADIEDARRSSIGVCSIIPCLSCRPWRPSSPARPTASAGGSTPPPGGGSPLRAIPRSSAKPRPHGHD